MAKLPPRKRTKTSGNSIGTSSQLGISKARPRKNFKNMKKKSVPSGSSLKPAKTTDSKTRPTQMKKKGNSKTRPTQMKKKGNKNNKLTKTKNPRIKKRDMRLDPDNPKEHIVMKEWYSSAKEKHGKLMKKFGNVVKETRKVKKDTKVDPSQLIDLNMLQTAVSGLRKLPSAGKSEMKSLHDITDEDERPVYLQVTLCKLPKVTEDFHLNRPTTVSVYLPHSLATDNTDVILITKDLQRGIKRDHQNSLNHFKELLHSHQATSLVNEIIPLRQLKVEYREFEAKRLLANRTDVLLCDDTVMRFIPKFLTKHFYTKKKLPVQVNLKAKDLQKELLRALAVSRLFFSMKGNSSIMKVGCMTQTNDEIQENVLAAVEKLASHAPGKWANIQGLGLKLESTTSIPVYVKTDSLNNVKPVPVRPMFPGEIVSGIVSTQPGQYVTVFPDGSITSTRLTRKHKKLMEKEVTSTKIEETDAKGGKKGRQRKKSTTSENNVGLPETVTEVSSIKKEAKEKNSTKRKATERKSGKVKKQKKAHGSDSDSDSEDDLEEKEMMYLRQLNQGKEEAAGNQEEDEDSEDVWAESESDIEESD